jgi:hypothetical protein
LFEYSSIIHQGEVNWLNPTVYLIGIDTIAISNVLVKSAVPSLENVIGT